MEARISFTRHEAIDALRRNLELFGGGEHSTCQIAAELGIFCRGFRRWNDHEFHRRWKPLLGESTHLTRRQVERLADLWEIAEQLSHRARVTCDARAISPGPCRGWTEFSDAELARFCAELLGVTVIVAGQTVTEGEPGPPPASAEIDTEKLDPARATAVSWSRKDPGPPGGSS